MFTLTKGGIDSHGTVELLLQSSNDPVVCICIYDGKDESVECEYSYVLIQLILIIFDLLMAYKCDLYKEVVSLSK